jgi:sugar diacid utilization regulator
MVVRCKDILKLPTLKKMTLVGGSEGLNRIVTWPYIVQMNSVCEYLHGGELLFVTGIGIKTDIESLKSLVAESYSNNLAGIVLMVGNQYITQIPTEVIALSDYLKVPLFKIPWECLLVEMTREIGNYIIRMQNEDESLQNLMAEILYGQTNDEQSKINRAAAFGYDFTKPHLAVIVSMSKLRNGNVHKMKESMEYYHHVAQGLLCERKGKTMIMSQNSCIVMFVPEQSENVKKSISSQLETTCKTLMQSFIGLQVTVGIGRTYIGCANIRKSFYEAQKAIEVTGKMNTGKNVFSYLDLGIYRLVNDISDEAKIESYCNENIGKLVEYDNLNSSDLVKTFEVYFENKFNLSQTSKALYIHRNSLIYRLKRIKEIIGRDIDDPYILLDILNSITVRKLGHGDYEKIVDVQNRA